MSVDQLTQAKQQLFALERQEAELSTHLAHAQADSVHAQNRIDKVSKDTYHKAVAVADNFGSTKRLDGKIAHDQNIISSDATAAGNDQTSLQQVQASKAQVQAQIAELSKSRAPLDAAGERLLHETGFGSLEGARQAFLKAETIGQKALHETLDSWAVGSTKDRKKFGELAEAREFVLSGVQLHNQARISLDSISPLPQMAELLSVFDAAIENSYADADINQKIKHDLVNIHYAVGQVLLEEQAEIPKLIAARHAANAPGY